MEVEKQLINLLYQHQSVCIPNFGTLTTQREAAEIGVFSNIFSPPKKIIQFDENLKGNDVFLINSISKELKISTEESKYKIKNKVLEWQEKLIKNGEFFIDKIGRFYLNSEQKITFVQEDSINFLTDSFGLSSFTFPMLEDFEKVEKTIIQPEQDVEEENSTQENVTPLYPEKTDDEEEIYPVIYKKNTPYLKYIGILTVVILIVGVAGYQLQQYETDAKKPLATEIEKQTLDSIQKDTVSIKTPIPPVPANIEKEETEKVPEEIVETNIKDTETSAKNTYKSYKIMAGIFDDEEKANKLLEELIFLGYEPKKINKKGNYYIIYEEYSTQSEAVSEMKIIRKTTNPDAWLIKD